MSKEKMVNPLIRVVLGIIFVAHSIAKFQMGLDNVSGWFSSIGIWGFIAYLVAYLELLGGIALIVGFATRFVSTAFIVMLLGAIVMVKLPAGLLGNGQTAGYELDLALILNAVYLLVTGAGAYSVDKLLGIGKFGSATENAKNA